MVTALLLPLQWGGVTKPWSDPAVYALFPVFAVLLGIFIWTQWRLGTRAILPLAMMRRRAQIGTSAEAFFVFLALLLGTYYLPLWYQATRGHSATKSGIDILPFMLAVVIGECLPSCHHGTITDLLSASGVAGGVISVYHGILAGIVRQLMFRS